MSTQELQSYRLSSLEEPTDEMLHAIMEQVAESAKLSTVNAQKNIAERFRQLNEQIADVRAQYSSNR